LRYLLDTNVCADYLNGRFPRVIEQLQRVRPEDVAVSAIAVAELRFGAAKSARPAENQRRLDEFLEEVSALDFDLGAAAAYGRLRSDLEARGKPIGPNDMLIAAQALAHQLVLVTDNVDGFARIDGLAVENWRA
jgi:tRNA(fMet)-specific endonuclease VapC